MIWHPMIWHHTSIHTLQLPYQAIKLSQSTYWFFRGGRELLSKERWETPHISGSFSASWTCKVATLPIVPSCRIRGNWEIFEKKFFFIIVIGSELIHLDPTVSFIYNIWFIPCGLFKHMAKITCVLSRASIHQYTKQATLVGLKSKYTLFLNDWVFLSFHCCSATDCLSLC